MGNKGQNRIWGDQETAGNNHKVGHCALITELRNLVQYSNGLKKSGIKLLRLYWLETSDVGIQMYH
jgi:hypothetical protein